MHVIMDKSMDVHYQSTTVFIMIPDIITQQNVIETIYVIPPPVIMIQSTKNMNAK